ncbi:hypothetical protein BLA29_014272, partial [Euroglyphus maynei]
MESLLKTRKQSIQNFIGPVCAVATAFNESDGQLNTNQIVDYARHLINIGVKGVYILGTTGESFTLTLEEKCHLIRAWNDALLKLEDTEGGKHLLAIVNVSAMS